jgi:hypothetical protein
MSVEMELMARARLLNFLPLYCLKNCIIQETNRFGLNNYQLSTMDKAPKSYLVLVAFYRGSGDSLEVIPIVNSARQFLALHNGATH